jgi:hypothetical protein
MNKEHYKNELVKEIIEGYCSEHKINEKDFALLIDVHPAHLPRIKSGEMCSYDTLGKIAILGGQKIEELLRPLPNSLREEILQIGNQKGLPVPS